MSQLGSSSEGGAVHHCAHCGQENPAASRFCSNCGAASATGDQPLTATAVMPRPATQLARPCPACGREWGSGIACQFCDQVEGLPAGVHLASSARRFGAHMLDVLLIFVTLGIGWLVWQLIIAANGQSPAKQLLGMRVVKLRTGTRATWGTMFIREVVLKDILFAALATITFGLGVLLYLWLVWDKNRQELWDKMISTIVVNDPQRSLA